MTAPPPNTAQPGTETWARWQIQNAFTTDEDRRAITDLVALALANGSRHGIGVPYARVCIERHWSGWQARMVWAILEAMLKPLDDDIPF